jgi:hypothetical protein
MRYPMYVKLSKSATTDFSTKLFEYMTIYLDI